MPARLGAGLLDLKPNQISPSASKHPKVVAAIRQLTTHAQAFPRRVHCWPGTLTKYILICESAIKLDKIVRDNVLVQNRC